MKINDDHMFHGAALTQIAEHDMFTSINAFRIDGSLSRSAFRVNENIGVYLKYASKKTGTDYVFTFSQANIMELQRLEELCERVYVALVCVKDRQICCVTLDELQDWWDKRTEKLGHEEDTSTMLLNVPEGKSFRLNMNMPGKKKTYLATPQIIARSRFPNALFE